MRVIKNVSYNSLDNITVANREHGDEATRRRFLVVLARSMQQGKEYGDSTHRANGNHGEISAVPLNRAAGVGNIVKWDLAYGKCRAR